MIEKGIVNIQINNKMRLPVGDKASFFPRSISEIINNHCDLYYDCWTEVPDEMKQVLKNHVKVQFPLFICSMPLVTNKVTNFLPLFV